jgi:hypothetical protein
MTKTESTMCRVRMTAPNSDDMMGKLNSRNSILFVKFDKINSKSINVGQKHSI